MVAPKLMVTPPTLTITCGTTAPALVSAMSSKFTRTALLWFEWN